MEERPSCYIGLRNKATNEDKKIWICDQFLNGIVNINTISILQIVFIKFCEFAGTKYSNGGNLDVSQTTSLLQM